MNFPPEARAASRAAVSCKSVSSNIICQIQILSVKDFHSSCLFTYRTPESTRKPSCNCLQEPQGVYFSCFFEVLFKLPVPVIQVLMTRIVGVTGHMSQSQRHDRDSTTSSRSRSPVTVGGLYSSKKKHSGFLQKSPLMVSNFCESL